MTTGRVGQERAPIWETLTGYARSGIYGFHTPGHKSGRFAAPEIEAMVGKRGGMRHSWDIQCVKRR